MQVKYFVLKKCAVRNNIYKKFLRRSMMKNSPKICILGGGNGAFSAAADLAIKGFKVNLCEVPEMKTNVEAVKEKGGIDLEVVIDIPGLKSGFAKLDKVGVDFEEALDGVDLIFAVVPAFAQKRFAELAAPFLRPNQVVALTPGNFGGSMEFAQVLNEKKVKEKPILVDVECMIYSGFKNGPASVQVSGFKRTILYSTFPATRIAEAEKLLNQAYPGLKAGGNVLEIGLRNGNSVVHPPITLLNMGWIEKTHGDFRFYWDGLTPGVAEVVERLEEERLNIGKSLGLQLTPAYEVVLGYYADQGAKGSRYTEVMATNPVYVIDYAPKSLQHRFIFEDIPYGLVPMEEMGKLANVPTPIITGLIEIASAAVKTDLRKGARNLKSLGLEGKSIDQIKDIVNKTGF